MKKEITGMVVLNYNDYSSTENLLKIVDTITSIDVIIVVDNCSTDDSFIQLKKFVSRKISVIKTEANRGYAAGNNFGIKYAIEKLSVDNLFIANPDIIIDKTVIDGLLSYLDLNPRIGIVSCLMKKPDGDICESAWKLPGLKECIFDSFILLKHFCKNKWDYEESIDGIKPICVDVIPGSFFAIKSQVMKDIGYFDEHTFLYYEENILSMKAKEKGYSNYILCNYSYIHNHSVTINKNITSVRNKLRIAYDSRVIYCEKYLKIGKFEELLLFVSYVLGSNSYIVAKKVSELFRTKNSIK